MGPLAFGIAGAYLVALTDISVSLSLLLLLQCLSLLVLWFMSCFVQMPLL